MIDFKIVRFEAWSEGDLCDYLGAHRWRWFGRCEEVSVPALKYLGRVYDCRPGESVLDALMRQGGDIPFSCRNGVCQVCLQRCVEGTVDAECQRGLRPGLMELGYFLPCRCRPEGDLEFAPPRGEDLFTQAQVHDKTLLTASVCRLLLEPVTRFEYRAGQFVNLRRADGIARSYSLASHPDEDYFLELHVKRMRNGMMSNWIFDTLQPGDLVDIQGPEGRACYRDGSPAENVLLIGSGTGLAPLAGIARAALGAGHLGEIHLVHGASGASELYLRDALTGLAAAHGNFHYTACVARGRVPAGGRKGRPQDVAFGLRPDVRGWRVYLAGPEELVDAARELALRSGARPDRIHSDPFVYRELRKAPRPEPKVCSSGAEVAVRFEPDPEMWAALGEGEFMTDILTDFYTQVFEDPQLAPYFHGVTRQRLIEKVYSFMHQVFTGRKVYFGDRPRNAHHWMVISDELFDHREALMVSVLRRHGLSEHLVKRWRAVEEHFRSDIVKQKAWPKVAGGVELPLDGYEETVIEVGTVCDGCAGEVRPGERVRYHLRIGSTYCSGCAALVTEPGARDAALDAN